MAQRLLKLRGYYFTQEGFFTALRLGDGRAVKAFLQGGMDPNIRNSNGQTALTFALEVTDAAKIEPLLQAADLSMSDGLGNSPLFMAFRFEHRELFDQLLEKGLDVNSRGRNPGNNTNVLTVLHLAVQRRDQATVQKLLEKGANPNLADDSGTVPLFDTVAREPSSLEIMNLLIEKGADVNYAGPGKGLTTLIYAAMNYNIPPEIKLQMMKTLLEKGANPNRQDTQNGYTALMYSAIDYRTPPETKNEILKMLLEKGADRTLKNADGETAMDWAKQNQDAEMAAILK
jgi:ankyrin repeat protein